MKIPLHFFMAFICIFAAFVAASTGDVYESILLIVGAILLTDQMGEK